MGLYNKAKGNDMKVKSGKEVVQDLSSFYLRKANMKKDLEISKILTISTEHISKEDIDALEKGTDAGWSQLVCYKYEYGDFVYIPSAKDIAGLSAGKNLPKYFIKLLQLAAENDCKFLVLDCDADVLDGYKTFDW